MLFATLGVVTGSLLRPKIDFNFGSQNVKNPPLLAAVLCSQRAMLYIPGEYICITGAYDVLHSGHRAPHQVWLLANEKFPRCRQCGSGVLFKFVGRASEPTCDHVSTDQDFAN